MRQRRKVKERLRRELRQPLLLVFLTLWSTSTLLARVEDSSPSRAGYATDRGQILSAPTSKLCGKKKKKKEKFVSTEERLEILSRAEATLESSDGDSKDLLRGPSGAPAKIDPATGFIPSLTLEYKKEKGVSGTTNKFWARDETGRKWKVKYDSEEVFTEIAATRLMWKMGYAADIVFPVEELICVGCKDDDPWKSMDHGRDPPVEGKRVLFRHVIVERALQHFVPEGRKIETFDGEGVALEDISLLISEAWQEDPTRASGLDSLKALAFMLQHADSKPANQRLVAMTTANDMGEHRTSSVVFFQDAGVSFGRGRGNFLVSSFKFERWLAQLSSPWTSEEMLTLNLPRSLDAKGGWRFPSISKSGLRFFLERADRLERRDLIEIFRLARFPEGSGVSAERWADAWELGIANLRARVP